MLNHLRCEVCRPNPAQRRRTSMMLSVLRSPCRHSARLFWFSRLHRPASVEVHRPSPKYHGQTHHRATWFSHLAGCSPHRSLSHHCCPARHACHRPRIQGSRHRSLWLHRRVSSQQSPQRILTSVTLSRPSLTPVTLSAARSARRRRGSTSQSCSRTLRRPSSMQL